jgi:hypothetical protein
MFEAKDGQRFEDFIEIIKDFSNFRITLSFYFYSEGYVRETDLAFKRNVDRFIVSPNIRSLKLALFNQEHTTDFEYLSSILNSVPQLEELNLRMDLDNGVLSSESWKKDFVITKPLFGLKKLKLQLPIREVKEEERSKCKELFRKLL